MVNSAQETERTRSSSVQTSPARQRPAKIGDGAFLSPRFAAIGITNEQSEQVALHPKLQMPAILSAGPMTNLLQRDRRPPAVLLEELEQDLRLLQHRRVAVHSGSSALHVAPPLRSACGAGMIADSLNFELAVVVPKAPHSPSQEAQEELNGKVVETG